MLSRADRTQRSSLRAGSKMPEWAGVAGEPGEMLPSLLWPDGDMSELRAGGGGGRGAPPASWMLFSDKKYLVAACRSCSRSSAVWRLEKRTKGSML